MPSSKTVKEVRPDKDPNADIKIRNGFTEKLSNFWYYHKWHLLIGAFVIALIIIFINQISVGEKHDGYILMGGPYQPTASEKRGMALAFSEVLPADYNEDGEFSVEIIHYEVYSTEQFKAIPGVGKDSNANVDNIKSLNSLITVGDYPICIIDKWLYEDLKTADGVRPLSEILGGEVADCAIDEYGIAFTSTDFAATFSAFSYMPDSTVLCFRTESVFGSDEESYKNAEALFRAIVEYSPES